MKSYVLMRVSVALQLSFLWRGLSNDQYSDARREDYVTRHKPRSALRDYSREAAVAAKSYS